MSETLNSPPVQRKHFARLHAKPKVRYLTLEIIDTAAAPRRWLTAKPIRPRPGVPQITTEEPWETNNPDTCFNIGLTYEGLRRARHPVPPRWLTPSPTEFVEGMTARALKLGDVGRERAGNLASSLQRARAGPSHRDDLRRRRSTQLDDVQQRALADGKGLEIARHARRLVFPGDYRSLRVSRQHHATEVRGGCPTRSAIPTGQPNGAARHGVAGICRPIWKV